MTSTTSELRSHVVQGAMLAPSVHNTQPWRFTDDDDGLDLWADAGRRLPVLDPDGRQLHLSCGAALQHAQVAARALGLDSDIVLLPDPADPAHLARMRLRAGAPPTADDQALAEAIVHRHTHREAFDDRPVPAALLEQLRLTAQRHGARLSAVTDPDQLLELQVLLSHADRAEEVNDAYRQETAAWVRSTPSDDGIDSASLPADPERGSSLRLRDFALAGPRPGGDDPPLAERPAVAVLVATDDAPESWLQAGRALGAVLLHAAQQGVLAQPLGQVTDLPASRQLLARALGLIGAPQLVLRLGYATSTTTSPRRAIADVLTTAAGHDPRRPQPRSTP